MAFGNTKAAFDLFSESVRNGNGRIKSLKDTISAATVGMNWWAVGIGAAITAISLIAKAVEEYKQKLREAAQEASKQAEESSNAVKSLLELKTQLNEGTKSSDELTLAFKEQLKAMGWTETKIDSLIKKYGGLAGAIDEATREALENAKRDAYADVSTSGQTLIQEAKGNTHVGTYYSQNAELSTQIRKMLADSPAILDGGTYRMSKDASAADIYEYYNTLKDISRLIQETAAKTGDESLLRLDSTSPTPYYRVTEALNALSESAKQYGDAINRLHSADAQLELSNFLKTNDIATQEDFNAYIKGIEDGTIGMVNGKEASDEYKQVLIDVANDAFPQFSNSAKDAGENANKVTDSLSSAIKAAESAFELFNEVEKDFNSTGAISAENIQKILNKFPELEDELYEYIIGMRSCTSVMELLKTKSNDMATMSAVAFRKMYLSSNSASKDIKDGFATTFKAIGLGWDNTQSVMANVNTKIIDANGTVTRQFTTQWANACQQAGVSVQSFAEGLNSLFTGGVWDGTSGAYVKDGYAIQHNADGSHYTFANTTTLKIIDDLKNHGKTINGTKYYSPYYDQYGKYVNSDGSTNIIGGKSLYSAVNDTYVKQIQKNYTDQAEFERRQKEFEERMKQYAITSDDKSGSDKNEALDNYLKDAENRYKVHQDETKYIQELQWAHDNLTKSDKERLDIIGKINEAYRDLADNRIKDLEHQNDLLLAQGKVEYDLISNYRQMQDVLHKEAERLRSMGYDGNSNEIQDLQSKWLDYDKKILDADLGNSKKWIDERNRLGDWHLFNDDEVSAWERVVKWLKEDYPNAIEEIKEAEESLYEARKEQFEKATDFANSYLDSQKTLLQSHFDVINAISDTQHEINKELEASKTMYEWLDEDTRKLLFNQEDYNTLSKKLIDIQSEANRLQKQYEYDLEHATLNTIEEITSNYEMQYETLMKSYEIAKADLEIAKKKQKLNNVLNEKNVKMLIDGQWKWVANTQDVIDAQKELADAEYAKQTAQAGLRQTESINELTKKQNKLGLIIDNFSDGVITLEEAMDKAARLFKNFPNNTSNSSGNKKNNSISGGSSSGNSIDYDPNIDYAAEMSKYDRGDAEWYRLNRERNAKIDALNLPYSKIYGDGTRNTSGGLSLLGEKEPEIFIDNQGHLIPINQPTLANIGAGGTVFNQEQLANVRDLWDLSNLNISPSILPNVNTPNQSHTESYNLYGDIHLNGIQDANALLRQIIKRFKSV